MKTIETLSNLSQAFLLRSMLEAEGIAAFLPDETMSQLGPFTGGGGIRVQVAEEDAARALPVVREFWKPSAPPAPEA